MGCPLFDEAGLSRCLAVCGDHVPTCHERERYCQTEWNWGSCPTMSAYREEGGPISETRYFALWTVPDDGTPRTDAEIFEDDDAPNANNRT